MRISDWSSDWCSSDLRCLRPCLAEQAIDLVCGEPVGLATELAADVGAAPDDRGPGLVPAQRLEHGGHSPLRAGAGEAQRLVAEQADAFFMEQTGKQERKSTRMNSSH